MTSLNTLHNLRIIDFTWVLAGPYATRILADFGAEVIKVQPLLEQESDDYTNGYYQTWNRNKLGITLNLNKPEGIALAKKLTGISDIVVENFAPRVMDNWGLNYDNLVKSSQYFLNDITTGTLQLSQNYGEHLFFQTWQSGNGWIRAIRPECLCITDCRDHGGGNDRPYANGARVGSVAQWILRLAKALRARAERKGSG